MEMTLSEIRHKRDRAIVQRRLGEERRRHVNQCVADIIAQGKMEERRQTTRREEDQ
jgi:hypothetical protein